MKAEELMIGDFIKTNKGSWVEQELKDKYCKIRHLGQNYIATVFIDNQEITPYGSENSFEPIPLTEEILQKNFPDPSEIVWFPLDTKPGYFNIYWEYPSFGDREIRLNIQYAHELQHILKLCNINKEIQL